MKLTPDSISKLENLVNAALTAGLNKVIIGDDQIRGIDEKQTVVVVTDPKTLPANRDKILPDLGGKKLALTSISVLAARLALVRKQGGLEVEAVEAKNGVDISMLELSFGRTKVQYRCASPEFVKGVPKGINDTLAWAVKIPAKQVTLLAEAARAMGVDKVTVASKDGQTASFELIDSNNDVFSTELEPGAVTWLVQGEIAPTGFALNYPVKSLLPLLAKDAGTDVTVALGKQGIMSLNVFGLDFYVISVQ